MSVPINAYATRFLRGAPKYKRRANHRARKLGFTDAVHMLLFFEILKMRIEARKQASA